MSPLEEIRRWKETAKEPSKLSLPETSAPRKPQRCSEPRLAPFHHTAVVRKSFPSSKVKMEDQAVKSSPQPRPATSALPSRKRRRPPSFWFFGGALVAALLFAAVLAGYFLWRGARSEPPQVVARAGAEASTVPAVALPASAEAVMVTEDQQHVVDSAMSDLRAGDAPSALAKLQELKQVNPRLPSLDYMIALAAIQAGEIDMTAKAIESSLAKGERVSDAYALRAALEEFKSSDRGWSALGDLRSRAETYLHEAISSDLANPYPYIEMAMRLRGRGENVEAKRMLEAARSRLHPVDSYTLLDCTLLLIELQGKPDHELPLDLDPDKNAAFLFGAAYVAMRRGEFSTAAGLLLTGRDRLSPDLFVYLLGDPGLRQFAGRPEIAAFYQ